MTEQESGASPAQGPSSWPGSALPVPPGPRGEIRANCIAVVDACSQNNGPGNYNGQQPNILHMRDDYLKNALKVVTDPNILVNVISRRVKQLRRGNRPLVESLEHLSAEDTALREVAEGKITYELGPPDEPTRGNPIQVRNVARAPVPQAA